MREATRRASSILQTKNIVQCVAREGGAIVMLKVSIHIGTLSKDIDTYQMVSMRYRYYHDDETIVVLISQQVSLLPFVSSCY